MGFDKFEMMLADGGIFLSNVSNFEDGNEGSYSIDELLLGIGEICGEKHADDFAKIDAQFKQETIKHTFVSCWHNNDEESKYMWDRYVPACGGVAIKVNYYKVLQLMPKYLSDVIQPLFCVYDKSGAKFGVHDLFAFKNPSFKNEIEFRLVLNARILHLKTGVNLFDFEDIYIGDKVAHEFFSGRGMVSAAELEKKEGGITIKVPLEKLIDFVVHSNGNNSRRQLASLLEKYKYQFPIKNSRILSAEVGK